MLPESELEQLRRERDELLEIFNNAADEIFVIDGEGNTLWVNKTCETLYGLKAEQLVGRNVRELEKEGMFSPSLSAVVLKEKKPITRTQATRRGRVIEVRGNPVLNPDGTIHRVIFVSRDITELSQLRKRLKETEQLIDSYRTELLELKGERIKGEDLLTASGLMEEILNLAQRLAQVESTVLLTGESGVGKSAIASFIHKHSRRAKGPFVTINCGAIPQNLMESELFGYEPGAFTGAKKEGKKGLLELADQGTVFLDEVGELPLVLQVKLLRVLQDKVLYRVGGQKEIKVDLRFIAATNRNLEDLVKQGLFREDLFYRLNVVPLRIPPLRERKEDIALLLEYFLGRYEEKYDLHKRISPQAIELLMSYSWPGNVRELENLIERLVVTTDGPQIEAYHLPDYIQGNKNSPLKEKILVQDVCTLAEAVEALERQLIQKAYTRWPNTYKVAEILGVNQSTVVRKLKKYGVRPRK